MRFSCKHYNGHCEMLPGTSPVRDNQVPALPWAWMWLLVFWYHREKGRAAIIISPPLLNASPTPLHPRGLLQLLWTPIMDAGRLLQSRGEILGHVQLVGVYFQLILLSLLVIFKNSDIPHRNLTSLKDSSSGPSGPHSHVDIIEWCWGTDAPFERHVDSPVYHSPYPSLMSTGLC